jgi:hypothetical protein
MKQLALLLGIIFLNSTAFASVRVELDELTAWEASCFIGKPISYAGVLDFKISYDFQEDTKGPQKFKIQVYDKAAKKMMKDPLISIPSVFYRYGILDLRRHLIGTLRGNVYLQVADVCPVGAKSEKDYDILVTPLPKENDL